jgi:ribosomal protein S18 acetylase RimI-like enzyme
LEKSEGATLALGSPAAPSSETVRPLRIANITSTERKSAAELLARAFRDNPLNCAVIPGDDRRRLRCNRHGLRASLAASFGHATVLGTKFPTAGSRGHDASRTPEFAAVLVAAAPNAYPFPHPPLLAQLLCLWGQGFEVQRRWSYVFGRLTALHPLDPHWYLSVLGVDPARQGQGHGRALLDYWLRQVDEAGEPGYLETDRSSSVRFYRRAGFEVVEELKIFDVDIWCMRRPACV